jgi:prolyl-tRNA synthetase
MPRSQFVETLPRQLDEIQGTLLDRARAFRQEHTVQIDSKDEFYAFFTPKNRDKPEIHGGFALAHWCGDPEVEEQVKRDLQVTIRSIPLGGEAEAGTCPFTGKPSPRRVVFAKAY